MKEQCGTCENRNKYFSSGCSEDDAEPKAEGSCKYYSPDMRKCPTCDKVIFRTDMILVKDMFGIPYKHVCPDCVERTERELQPYPREEAEYNY